MVAHDRPSKVVVCYRNYCTAMTLCGNTSQATEIYSNICLQTLSVLSSKHFSKSKENCELRGTAVSKDKYLGIFSRQMETTVFMILQILLTTWAVLKIGEYRSDIPQV